MNRRKKTDTNIQINTNTTKNTNLIDKSNSSLKSLGLLNISTLYEDNDLIVINKPAGVVVNRAESVREETIQDWIELKIKNHPPTGGSKIKDKENDVMSERVQNIKTSDNITGDFTQRSGIVHRLDKETSGCLIIAKTPESFLNLQTQFKEHKVKKTYIALVHGQMPSSDGEINAPVGRLPWNREQFGIVPGGKAAITKYKVINIYKTQTDKLKTGKPRSENRQPITDNQELFTFLELYPESGRTHQIRVHLKYLGHPVVGDYLYAGRKQQKNDRKWCPRVFLHAAKIEFFHPVTGQVIKVESPMPEELERILNFDICIFK